MSRNYFSGASLLYGDDLELVEGLALIVEDGRIIGLGTAPERGEVIDMSGKLLCPMFINSHTHIGDSGAKELGIGLPLDEAVNPPHGLKHRFLAALEPEVHIKHMRHAMLEMLYSGTIAFADFREGGVAGAAALRAAAAGLPIQAVVLGRMREQIQLKQALDEAAELLEVADGLGIRDVEAHEAEILQRIRHDYPGRLFAVHAAEDRRAQDRSFHDTNRGQVSRALEWGADILIHLVHASPEELGQAASQGSFAVSCPRSNAIIGDGFADLNAWTRTGLTFGLGTDNMMFCSPDLLREMDFAARIGRGLHKDPTAVDTIEILKAVTINGARLLRMDGHLGSLAPGKDASFIAFDLQSPNLRYTHDPRSAIVHRASRSDINAIYIQGEPLQAHLNVL